MRGSPRKFGLESRLQGSFFSGAQVGHFVLVVERHQPDLSIRRIRAADGRVALARRQSRILGRS